MTDEEKKKLDHIKAELQTLKNEADRPRLRALEEASYMSPGYYGKQPTEQLGHWSVDGVGVPDGSIEYPTAPVGRKSHRKSPVTTWIVK